MSNQLGVTVNGVHKVGTSAYLTVNGIHRRVGNAFLTLNRKHKQVYSYVLPTATIIYNANGGTFDNGANINTVEYNMRKGFEDITKISKTSNVSDDGSSANVSVNGGGYGDNQSITDVITIEGAESLEVTITYQTEYITCDWVCVYDKTVVPSNTNYDDSVSGRLGGTTKTTKTFTVNGDTAQIYLKSDGSTSYYYGYYAVVTGRGLTTVGVITSGIEKEPVNNNGDGLLFMGWYLDPECTAANKFDIKKVKNEETVNVYAKWGQRLDVLLKDFDYVENDNGTATITGWKGTLNGVASTELIIPDDERIIL